MAHYTIGIVTKSNDSVLIEKQLCEIRDNQNWDYFEVAGYGTDLITTEDGKENQFQAKINQIDFDKSPKLSNVREIFVREIHALGIWPGNQSVSFTIRNLPFRYPGQYLTLVDIHI